MTQPAQLRLVKTPGTHAPAAPIRSHDHAGSPGHTVQFYDDDAFLTASVADYLAEGLQAGQPLIVIATAEHRTAFTAALAARGFDLRDPVASRESVWLDAHETLNTFMEGPRPNRELFMATVGNVFEKLLHGRTYIAVRAYGEMVNVLWKEGNVEGAIAVEELWNELAIRYSFTLLCAYAMGSFFKEAHTESFLEICRQHELVRPTEAYSEADETARLYEVTRLQQRARALEAEIHHRKELERALREVLALRRKAEDALYRKERELRDFLENAVEPIHSVGPDGIILWANRAELELLGYERDEFVGRHIVEFHADRIVCGEMLTRLARGEEIRDFEAKLVCKNGSIKHVVVNSNVFFENGQFAYTRCFTRDITNLRAIAAAS